MSADLLSIPLPLDGQEARMAITRAVNTVRVFEESKQHDD